MTSLRFEQNVQFILLAEFDIDQGSVLSHQYPFPTGTDEQQLAELMLPDGVHQRSEDWTIFLLNQSPENSIATPFHESEEVASETNGTKEDKQELLYVLNLVRTKHDQNVRRGALCKALAVCTHLPYIQIFKAAIVCALDNYFTEQSVDCLVRLFDSLNAMDISPAPIFTRHQKFILRTSDRRDLFVEKFAKRASCEASRPESRNAGHHSDDGAKRKLGGSTSSELVAEQPNNHARSASTGNPPSPIPSMETTVVAGDEPARESMENEKPLPNPHEPSGKQDGYLNGLSTDSLPERRSFTKPVNRDTRVFEAQVKYGELNLPIKLPLTTFTEEIGDFSLIELIQTFSAPNVTITGPLHPHLHTNGSQTHPVIILFNALITHKRVIFLGYGKPAGYVCNFVLAACALASGSGCYLRGFTERAFPYVNLLSKKVLDPFQKSGYIAGVTNPIFENIQIWDVLCDIVKGSITIHAGLASPEPTTGVFPVPPALIPRTGVLRSEGTAEDEFGRLSSTGGREPSVTVNSQGQSKNDYPSRTDSYDAQFMEDILLSISYRAGEAQIRARFAEYVYRFIQLASRYEEDTQGSTSIGHPCQPFKISPKTREARLGSGIRFSDEIMGMREIGANAGRIEGWRKSISYEYWATDFHLETEASPIQGFDVIHQVLRLRNGKNVPDEEIRLVLRAFIEKVSTYDQVVEFLSYFPPQHGGLQPLAMALFHQQPDIRDLTVEFLNVLREHSIGFAFLQSLNQFHRYAYIRLAYEREQQQWRDAHPLYHSDPSPAFNDREDRSNESE